MQRQAGIMEEDAKERGGPESSEYGTMMTSCRTSPSAPLDSGGGDVDENDQGGRALPTAEGEVLQKRFRRALGVGYFLGTGVCGSLFVAMGSSLYKLSSNCGTTSTGVGTVFLARGIGSALGSACSPKIYGSIRKNTAISVSLLALVPILICMPFITSVVFLHVAYFAFGLLLCIVNTGCQIMTTTVHGTNAGPWLGANSVAFIVAGISSPLIDFFTDSLLAQYVTLAVASGIAGVYIIILPVPETFPGMRLHGANEAVFSRPLRDIRAKRTRTSRWLSFYGTYRVQINIGAMIFWIMGSKDAVTAYLQTYIYNTGVVPSSKAQLVVVCLYVAFILGGLGGMAHQHYVALPGLYRNLTIFLYAGATVGVVLIIFKNSPVALWAGIAAYGLSNAPLWSYCLDLNNRLRKPTNTGTSILAFGSNFGSSMVSYLTSCLWSYTGSPRSLLAIIVVSQLLPHPIMLNVKHSTENRGDSAAVAPSYHSSEPTGEAIPLLGARATRA